MTTSTVSGRAPILCALLCTLLGCASREPACTFAGRGNEAPSAGCFATSADGLLLVQGLNGKVSLPGGSSRPGESAQCTAFRESWEETGLVLQPAELLMIFDTGFHLYRCESTQASGKTAPPLSLEIRSAFFLPADQFDQFDWRYEYQRALLRNMLLSSAPQ